MYNQKFLHRLVEKDVIRCRKLYNNMQQKLEVLPAGSISIRDGELCRAVRENGKQYLVPLRSDWQLYKALKHRRYIKKGLPVLKQRIEILEDFLKKDIFYDPEETEKMLPKQYLGVSGLDIFLENDIDVNEWIKASYERNPAPFTEEHYTKNKVKMRSKSEAMIGSRLEDYKIIYKPELGIRIGGRIIYPDYIILIPELRIIVIWEHFGKVDDKWYMYDKMSRLMDYGRAGFHLGVNLFITYEMRGKPLTMLDIDATISEILAIKEKFS